MSEKKERKTTPVGEAKWAHIHTPKAPFEGKGDPKYQIDVIFKQDDPEWNEWAQNVMKMVRELPKQIDKKTGMELQKNTPIKRELDENDQHTGRFYVTFKTNSKFKPGVFDVYGNQIPSDVLIGNGSKVRVSYTENVYTGFGGGVNFYLNAVQVVELVEYKTQGASAFGFPVEQSPECSEGTPTEDSIPFN